MSSSSDSIAGFKVHIAVDFGTDGVALAYTFGEVEKVFAHEWTQNRMEGFKQKNIVLLDEKNRVLAFGITAKRMYIEAEQNKHQWMLFERFKMKLADPNVTKLTAVNGKTVDAEVVFVAVFKFLLSETRHYLTRSKIPKHLFIGGMKERDIQWIITVPAIWNDVAKQRMREWAISAGLVARNIDDQCKIVCEPVCASMAVLLRNRAEIKDRNTDNIITVDDLEDTKCDGVDHEEQNTKNYSRSKQQ